MAWWIQERYVESDGLLRCLVFADTENDLPSAIQTDYTIAYGSDGLAVDTGKKYILNGVGSWVEQPDDNAWVNVYTKTEIDDIIQDVIDGELTRADIYRGYQIAANTDVNTLTDYGTYYCADGTTAATLSNCPITTSGFIMINFSNGNRVRLFLAISATIPRMYIQARTSSVWRTIRQFAMLDEIQADENMLGYSWGRYTVSEDTGNVLASTTRIGTEDYFEIPSGVTNVAYSPEFSGVSGQTFYLFYDSNKAYHSQYQNWTNSGTPVKFPTGAAYYRLAFRRPDNATIVVSDMIRCTRNYQ